MCVCTYIHMHTFSIYTHTHCARTCVCASMHVSLCMCVKRERPGLLSIAVINAMTNSTFGGRIYLVCFSGPDNTPSLREVGAGTQASAGEEP